MRSQTGGQQFGAVCYRPNRAETNTSNPFPPGNLAPLSHPQKSAAWRPGVEMSEDGIGVTWQTFMAPPPPPHMTMQRRRGETDTQTPVDNFRGDSAQRLERHCFSPPPPPREAPTSASLILGSCSGERQPMGWMGCVRGSRGSHLKMWGVWGWMGGKVGLSEERGMWVKENWELVFVAAQL
ncbi:hypothetical protein NQZ68_013090 [Dissostichus eleginoides]|nr:hypothetical protein NQZ68_013090 [Dissostichus eleginoides]